MKTRQLLACVSLATIATVGCVFNTEEYEGEDLTDVGCTTARSPDQCLEVFRDVYADMDFECYRDLLSEAYLFIPQGDDARYGYDEEIAIIRKMFDGVAGENGFVVQSISIDQLDPQGVWTDTPDNDPNFGTLPASQYRNYLVDIKFSIQGQNLILRVQGPVLYYVVDEGDADERDFRILGMVDATYGG